MIVALYRQWAVIDAAIEPVRSKSQPR